MAEPTGPEPLTVAEAASQTIKNIPEPSGELVESMNGEDVEDDKESKPSLEERKAKMEQLRAKMVSSSFRSVITHAKPSISSVPHPKQTEPP